MSGGSNSQLQWYAVLPPDVAVGPWLHDPEHQLQTAPQRGCLCGASGSYQQIGRILNPWALHMSHTPFSINDSRPAAQPAFGQAVDHSISDRTQQNP